MDNVPRNFFTTRTAQGIVTMTIAVGLATIPLAGQIAGRFTDDEKTKATINDVAALIIAGLGAVRTAQGRIYANGPAYTPDVLPGLDKPDAERLMANINSQEQGINQ